VEPTDLETVRQGLLHRRQELESRIATMAAPPEAGSTIGFGKRIGDGTTEAVSRLTDVGVGRGMETAQARVERALEKLDEGTYGLCDRCGDPIAPARLAAAPDSIHCIACARLVVPPARPARR
jgi:DnaK suppressor protein